MARLDFARSISEKSELLRKIAKVFEEKLDDKNQAFDALLQAIELTSSTATRRSTLSSWRTRHVGGTSSYNGGRMGPGRETDPKRKIRLYLHLAKWYGPKISIAQTTDNRCMRRLFTRIRTTWVRFDKWLVTLQAQR